MSAMLTADEIRDFNIRYHDAAAAHYDSKWAIDFGGASQERVQAKLTKALGASPAAGVAYANALEIGSGTGYFTLNLLGAGIIGKATCTDISPGMLKALRANAKARGLTVETVVADAEKLPFADDTFDLVFGHAVLHHLPDVGAALAEMHRVLQPGGTLVFAGEPSRLGDSLARVPKTLAHSAAPLWRALMRARPLTLGDEHQHDHDHGHAPGHGQAHANGSAGAAAGASADGVALEGSVDVQAFAPAQLAQMATSAGFQDVRVRGEELLANWFGWTNRTLEATAEPEDVPWLWRQYAYRGYLLLQALDGALLEGRLPAGVFYNLMLSAHKPGAASKAGASRKSSASRKSAAARKPTAARRAAAARKPSATRKPAAARKPGATRKPAAAPRSGASRKPATSRKPSA
jgi:ubiquinone/menaquinone biosynthesis C-methylase UbiE